MTVTSILSIATPFLVAALGWVSILLQRQTTRANKLEEMINTEKRKIYTELVDKYAQLFTKEMVNGKFESASETKIVSVVLDCHKFARQALMIASNEVLDAYREFYLNLSTPQLEDEQSLSLIERQFRSFAKLTSKMRKELGHSPHDLTAHELAELYINDYEGDFAK